VLVVPAEDVLLDLHHARLRQAGRVRVRGTGAEVDVVAVRHNASVIVRVPDDCPVRHPMFVLVRVFVIVVVAVIVIIPVSMNVVVVAVRPVLVLVLVRVRVRVIVTVVVPVHGAVGMPMLVSVLLAFDLRFAAAAAACCAHTVLLGPPQAISISFTRISSPCVTCNW
jgi:hypothetical protein